MIRTIVKVSLNLIMTIQKVAVVVVAVVVAETVVVKKANNKALLKLAAKFQIRRRSVNLWKTPFLMHLMFLETLILILIAYAHRSVKFHTSTNLLNHMFRHINLLHPYKKSFRLETSIHLEWTQEKLPNERHNLKLTDSVKKSWLMNKMRKSHLILNQTSLQHCHVTLQILIWLHMLRVETVTTCLHKITIFWLYQHINRFLTKLMLCARIKLYNNKILQMLVVSFVQIRVIRHLVRTLTILEQLRIITLCQVILI